MKNWGYARGLLHESREEITLQINEIMGAGADEVILEYRHINAKQRPPLGKLLEMVSPGDTIIVLEIKRICRSTHQFYELIQGIREKQLRLVALQGITIDCRPGETDPITEGHLGMIKAFHELEEESAKELARIHHRKEMRKNDSIGRPATTIEDIPLTFIQIFPMLEEKKLNISQAARLCRLSRPTVYKYIRILRQHAEAMSMEESDE